MERPLELQVHRLQAFYGSDRDPERRGFLGLAEAHRRLGRPREALRILREGLRRHPDLASAYVVLGWAHLDEGESEEAEAAFRAALERDPKNVAALRGLGDRLEAKGERTQALECYRKVLELEPTDRATRQRLELLERCSQDTGAAFQAFPVGAEAKVHTPWEDGAGVAEELDWSRARLQEDRSRGSSLSPELPEMWPGPGLEGRNSSARPEEEAPGEPWIPEEGVALRPAEDDVLLTRTLGEIYASQGLLEEAVEVFSRLVEREGDPTLEARLAEIRALAQEKVVGAAGAGVEEDALGGEGIPAHESDGGEVVPVEALAPEVVVAIGALAPERVVPIQELAPREVVPVEALAPEVVVAIGELGPERVVPIQELAPREVVPVEALAPEDILPIGDMAAGPEGLEGTEGRHEAEALSPQAGPAGDDAAFSTPPPPEGGTEPEEDPTLAAFEAWLKNLR